MQENKGLAKYLQKQVACAIKVKQPLNKIVET
jgi:hypothetical protein